MARSWVGVRRNINYVLEQAASNFDSRRSLTMTKQLLDSLVGLHNDEAGQGLVEYVLILALVALAAIATMKTLGNSINSAFTKIGSTLNSAVS
jgi:pilus assembly protein Flp/PilA